MMTGSDIYRIGVDAGSTTIKLVVLDGDSEIVYKSYRRHKADIHGTFLDEMKRLAGELGSVRMQFCFTGSAGMGIAERVGAPFVQEVVASVNLVQARFPGVQTLFDLGGEDAKMVFFRTAGHPDIRMNGSCAGGTGAFIDQMASLMNISVEELGEIAEKHEKIYPIASRCGVFAKTDIQNLISRNVPSADIAASTLHAVALQSITTLARGYDIKPPVLCIGGPLTFIKALRKSFARSLGLSADDLILPGNGEYFPAWGAAQNNEPDAVAVDIEEAVKSLQKTVSDSRTDILPRLFSDGEEYRQWDRNRKVRQLKFRNAGKGEKVECFLGIDSGSTTTKIVVMDTNSNIRYKFYSGNEGNSLKKVVEGLAQFYELAARQGFEVNILSTAVTGYGEDLIRSALNIDYGIVETMAHLCGAQYVDPDVSFILDIGGQDIKSIFIENGVIANIELNEACSAGCGSFLQNFASTINMGLDEFSRKACLSGSPADLGSRCTVFMNSKVKQSLRENASVDDIAAGLAYSVVKNCLFKVLKISNLNKLGDNIVVQGGTFRNDAVYRALELLSGKTVSSTDHPELMGAFGAALYARNKWSGKEAVSAFGGHASLALVDKVKTSELRCKGCTNTCSILKFKFENGNTSFAGNKCEKIFFNSHKSLRSGYNAFDHKNELIFDLPAGQGARMKTVGIPRVLNMFENYPFWHTLFTECGFDVVLSPESNFKLYQKGLGSVMSDNICFPAKLAHGHILALAEQKVDRIFYPLVPKEEKEFGNSSNSWNCPVVSGYPDVIRSSMDPEGRYGIPFDTPVIGFNGRKALRDTCRKYMETLGVDKGLFARAFGKACAVRESVRQEMVGFQKEQLDKAVRNNEPVFIITGRPYHADPLVHQKTGQILADLGVTVLTDDVFRDDPGQEYGRLNIVSQWSYPNRVIQSALKVAQLPPNVQLIQMNSFGCGPDSFFMDEAASILKASDKNLTIVRVDEIASPGSVRLRLRSLVESLRHKKTGNTVAGEYEGYRVPFEKEDKRRTIIAPWLADFVSPFLPAFAELAGYKMVALPRPNKESAETGLKYGHNEVCYPSTLVLGDIIKALQSGEYDLNNTAVGITQTGGQCRATNYIAQIKTGLERAGFTDIPIVVLSTGGTFQNDQKGFNIPWLKLAHIVAYGILYGDALNQMLAAIGARETEKGTSRKLFDKYMSLGVVAVRRNDHKELLGLLSQAVGEFNSVPAHDRKLDRIGLIGEIYVKYNDFAQANIGEWLRRKGMEVVTPPIFDFVMQYFVNSKVNTRHSIDKTGFAGRMLTPVLWKYLNKRIMAVESVMENFRYFTPSVSIYAKAQYASEVLNLSNQFGEGWMIAAEVAHFSHQGIDKVVCIQPFGCIANHVVAKGVEKRLKTLYPDTDLLYLDIDSGIAEVNLQNRLHFMIA